MVKYTSTANLINNLKKEVAARVTLYKQYTGFDLAKKVLLLTKEY